MKSKYPDGVWPVMLTPFTQDNQVDYASLERLTDWYINAGVAGLFAVCQSSEMFFLSLEERVSIARFVKEKAAGRVPVIASGHISDRIEEQAKELTLIAETGVDAIILLTNRLAAEDESDEVWLSNLKKLIDLLPPGLPLGFYECPYPYKRILSLNCLSWSVDTGRFYFLKDTSCDIQNIADKLTIMQGSQMKLFNANSASLLASLNMGAAGFSGVMANFQPDLYNWLCKNHVSEPNKVEIVSDFISVSALIERQVYPANAKYYLKSIGVINCIHTRTKDSALLNAVAQTEVNQLARLTNHFRQSNVMA